MMKAVGSSLLRCSIRAKHEVRYFGLDTGKDLSWNTSGVNRHGFPYPPDCTEGSLDFAEQWQPGPQDVFVSTYPKSGTTWTLHVLYQLASKGNLSFDLFTEVHPFWEATPDIHVALDEAAAPRVIKTHAPLSLLPSIHNPNAKHIYVFRDPRDVLVSFYNHTLLTRHLGFDGSFEAFFDKFMDGKLFYGSWFDHVADALQFQGQKNVLFLYYEDMAIDVHPALEQIMEFTGFRVDPALVEEMIPRFGFDFMKEHKMRFDFTLQYPTRAKVRCLERHPV
eukprot:NODE_1305_length_1014_cov_83.304663_g1005_i0.p1 GENE.NODE_1305_length_1014_cov_83.304663_g1005_i0~~NODE_1305_length_1014_cov_83.304663_g1005_i0.p1  ORF type:complete len:278 (-),score=55.61 NODE_1305_length_1014_cov_83.304663_g1005_i0:75-908(-)